MLLPLVKLHHIANALISCAVTSQLICVHDLAYANCCMIYVERALAMNAWKNMNGTVQYLIYMYVQQLQMITIKYINDLILINSMCTPSIKNLEEKKQQHKNNC